MQLFDEIRRLCTNIREEKKVSYSKINSITQKFKDEWIRIMAYSGLYNKMHKTYSLNNIEFKSFGIRCDIYIVAPLTYDILEKNLEEEDLLLKYQYYVQAHLIQTLTT